MEIRVDTQSEAWVAVIKSLLSAPVVAPRGLKVREASERVTVIIDKPWAGFVEADGRRLNHAITAVEGLSLVGQVSAPEAIFDRVKAFEPFANDGVMWGAYGPRIAGLLGEVVSLLKRDPDSRQAVLTLYEASRDIGRPDVRDVPCSLNVQFLLRPSAGRRDLYHQVLHMWVTMRSNDAWLGMPYDLGQFSMLQFAVAQALDSAPGTYTHSVGSMHLYEPHWSMAEGVGAPVGYSAGYVFGAMDIGEISSRCRRILLGQEELVPDQSHLERWLVSKMARPTA